MPELDDNTLVSYVDGELDAATAREVERALETSATARNTVAKLRSSATFVRAAFAEALHEPPPAGLVAMLRAATPRRPPARHWLPVAASIALLIGLAGGTVGTRQFERATTQGHDPMTRLLGDVADYHRVYAREQRHLVGVAASDTPHIEAWLGQRLKGQLVVPNLKSQGLTFQGGRLLAFEGRPMAELIYTPADGPPVGLCITFALPGMGGAATEQRGDLTISHWVDNGYVYSVVGWATDGRIHAIADSVRAQLHL